MIRFIKNVKVTAEVDIKLSSFDINAICYDIKKEKYIDLPFYQLVPIIYNQLKDLAENKTLADNLVSVDGREWIFRYNSDKYESLKKLLNEVQAIYLDLYNKGLVR